jgi:NTP pyrophosphatase (non-canonical NTP hydrolase)
MSYLTNGLSFRTLREANRKRLPQFRNALGEIAHTETDGSDWTAADWLTATVGELGELANVMKKVRRGDLTMEEANEMLRHEIADTMTYLDILALRLGIDLGEAVREKFNIVSRRVGAKVFIGYDDDWHKFDPDGEV